ERVAGIRISIQSALPANKRPVGASRVRSQACVTEGAISPERACHHRILKGLAAPGRCPVIMTSKHMARSLPLAVAVVVASADGRAQSIVGLGSLSGGFDSGARAVNANGAVVVGDATRHDLVPRMFRWSLRGSLEDIDPSDQEARYCGGVS